MEKVKKTDPPKTTQKSDLIDWAKSFWAFLKELQPFFENHKFWRYY